MVRDVCGRSALCLLLLAACAPESPQPLEAQLQQPVIGGVVDDLHPGVVAYSAAAECSGTVVHVESGEGWVLTAAHCVNQLNLGTIHYGPDRDSPLQTYMVTEAFVHPDYDNNFFDFAMLRFAIDSGDLLPEVILPFSAAQDKLTKGDTLTLVGYGVSATPPGGENAERRRIDRPIAGASAMRFQFDQSSGGVCSGDSGGAALYLHGDVHYLAGVHSSASETCDRGQSVRVSAVKQTFIDPVIKGAAFGTQSCLQCSDSAVSIGSCLANTAICVSDDACAAFAGCALGCVTEACVLDCVEADPSGCKAAKALTTCACEDACAEECKRTAMCAAFASCGDGESGGGGESGSSSGSGASSTTSAAVGAGGGGEPTQGGDDPEGCSCAMLGARRSPSGGWLVPLFAAAVALARRRRFRKVVELTVQVGND